MIASSGQYKRFACGLAALLGLLLSGCATPARTAASVRLQQMEARLAALSNSGVESESYALARANAWYQFARELQTQGDKVALVRAALDESESILQRVDAFGGVIHVQAAPRLRAGTRVRDDLWQSLASLEQDPYFPCAQGNIARMNVQLVAAGRAHETLGWRHAVPYVQAAQRFEKDARSQIAHCAGGLPPESAIAPDEAADSLTPTAPANPALPAVPMPLPSLERRQ